MLIGVIFKNGVEIRRGIWTGGKHWCEEYPEQKITITQDSHDYYNEERYVHDGVITFQELQDNGNGWEVVYDSNERIDRSVDYSLPSWFEKGGPIPDYQHKIDEDGEIESTFKGYIR